MSPDSNSQIPTILPNDTLIRRIPPSSENASRTKDRPGIGETATSFAIQPRSGEECPSWSLERITSPTELLAIEGQKGRNMTGWKVVRISVHDLLRLGLDVRADPLPAEDLGHCLIVPGPSGKFSNKIWSELAPLTRIVEV